MELELVELLVPEPFIFVHPSRCQAKRLRAKRDENFPPSFFPFDQPGTLEQFEVLCNGVEGDIEQLGDIQETGRPVRQLSDDRATRRVRDGAENVRQLIHEIYYTIRCNDWQASMEEFQPLERKADPRSLSDDSSRIGNLLYRGIQPTDRCV